MNARFEVKPNAGSHVLVPPTTQPEDDFSWYEGEVDEEYIAAVIAVWPEETS